MQHPNLKKNLVFTRGVEGVARKPRKTGDMNDQGLMGVFDDASSHKIISIVESINENAMGVG